MAGSPPAHKRVTSQPISSEVPGSANRFIKVEMPVINLRAISRPEPTRDWTGIPTDLIAAASVCLFLTIASVCARLFTRAVDLRRMHVDDCKSLEKGYWALANRSRHYSRRRSTFKALAWSFMLIIVKAGFVAFATLLFVGANSGLGSHISTLSAPALKRALLYSNALDIIYTPIMLATKLAILIQIDRLFSGTKKEVIYWGVRILAILNVLCYTAMFFVHVFACMPRAKIFDASVPGKCISQNTTIIASSAINVASDAGILLFAIWGVGRLRISGKRQLLVALVFAIGSFACVASICRLVYGVKVDGSLDFTSAIWPVHLWS
jgi:hypothetical protein